jgi:hypothetical protein
MKVLLEFSFSDTILSEKLQPSKKGSDLPFLLPVQLPTPLSPPYSHPVSQFPDIR